MAVPFEKIVTQDLNLGYGHVDVTAPAGGVMRGDKIGIHAFLGAVLNVADFGAIPDGHTDAILAFESALATLALIAPNGGILEVRGDFYLSRTLDLVTHGPLNVWIRGAGKGTTILRMPTAGQPAINLSTNATTCYKVVSDLSIYGVGKAGPFTVPASSSGHRAIYSDSLGPLTILRNLELLYFGDSAIRLQGSSGPVWVENCSIAYANGYGVEIGPGTDTFSCANVTVIGGSIQNCRGGILLDTVSGAFSARDVDIELGTVATRPALHLTGACYGNSFFNMTTSLRAVPSPAAVVALETNCVGNTFIGAQNFAFPDGVDNVLVSGIGTARNTFIGGLYLGSGAGSGYAFTISSAVLTRIDNPFVVESLYGSGKNSVNDTIDNQTIASGIACAGHSALGVNALTAPNVFTRLVGLTEGLTGITNVTGQAFLYVNASGELRIMFANGTDKLIVNNT